MALATGGSVFVNLLNKRKQNATPAVATNANSAAAKPKIIELLAQDLFVVQTSQFARSLPLSGALKAAESAAIKAKVAGDVVALSVREGDAITRGQVVARIDSTEFTARAAQARNTYLAAVAQVEIAQRNFESNKALVDKEFISKMALDTSLNNLQAARANSAASKAALDVTEKSLGDTVVRSPLAGTVSLRLVQLGEKVGVDARLLEVVNLATLELEASVPSSDIGEVKVGQKAQVMVDGSSKPVAAVVTRINPSTQSGSRTVLVYLKMESLAGLRQGMFAQGNLGIGTVSDSIVVPLSSVRTDAPKPYVFALANDVIVTKLVTLGEQSSSANASGETLVRITEGLVAGERIVKGSVGALQNGIGVKVTELAAK